jgi:hypothetical protein
MIGCINALQNLERLISMQAPPVTISILYHLQISSVARKQNARSV